MFQWHSEEGGLLGNFTCKVVYLFRKGICKCVLFWKLFLIGKSARNSAVTFTCDLSSWTS